MVIHKCCFNIDNVAASGDEPGAAIFISVFFIKFCLIPIRPQQDVRHPFRGSAHLFADSFQINAGAAFNDQFIMDMSDDKAVPEGFHGVAEDVPADGLNDMSIPGDSEPPFR